MRILTTVICGGALLAGTANAEIYGYQVLGQKVELTRPDQADVVTSVYNYQRPEYRPEGVRAGSFDVYATAKGELSYNDNIYATENNEEGDFIFAVKPAIVAKSDWGRHELVGRVHGAAVEYADNDDESYQDYGANVSGRLDVARNSYAFASVGADVKHEDRGEPNATTSATKPTEYAETQGQIGYVHAQGKMSVSGFVDYKELDYDDGYTSTGTVVDQDSRDRDETNMTVQVGYEVQPNYEAFVRGTLTDVAYDQTASQGRDSDGYSVVAGMGMDLTGKVRGEVYAGYMSREYEDEATYNNITKPTYGANVLWNVNGLTSVSFDANRSIGETTTANSSGYVSTGFNAGIQHELRRNVLLSANAGYANHDYIGYAITREDDYTNFGAEATYLINKCYTVGLRYDYTNRDSNATNSDYDRNVIMAKITGSL